MWAFLPALQRYECQKKKTLDSSSENVYFPLHCQHHPAIKQKKKTEKKIWSDSPAVSVRGWDELQVASCSTPAPPPPSRKRLKTRKLRLSCIDWEPKWRGVRDGRREGGGRVNIWGGGGGGGVNFDRRMEASVGKSPEGEQLLMPSNRSPIQDFISVPASCFLFLLPILLSCFLLSFPLLSPFHPPPDFFLPTAPLVLPTLFLSLYSFIFPFAIIS